MDLRPRNYHGNGSSYRTDVSSSLVSLGSLSSIDSKDNNNRSSLKLSSQYVIENGIIDEHGDCMFQVANGGTGLNNMMGGNNNNNNGSASHGSKGGGEAPPMHWEKTRPEGNDRTNNNSYGNNDPHQQQQQQQQPPDMSGIRRMSTQSIFSLAAESRKSFDKMVSRVSSGGGGGHDNNNASGDDNNPKRASICTVNLKKSGIFSVCALRDLGDAGMMSDDSQMMSDDDGDDDDDSSRSSWTESSPLTDDGIRSLGRRRRRQRAKLRSRMLLRMCARAMAGVLALAALSGSVIIYFIPKEERELLLKSLLEYNLLGRVLGSAVETQETKDSFTN